MNSIDSVHDQGTGVWGNVWSGVSRGVVWRISWVVIIKISGSHWGSISVGSAWRVVVGGNLSLTRGFGDDLGLRWGGVSHSRYWSKGWEWSGILGVEVGGVWRVTGIWIWEWVIISGWGSPVWGDISWGWIVIWIDSVISSCSPVWIIAWGVVAWPVWRSISGVVWGDPGSVGASLIIWHQYYRRSLPGDWQLAVGWYSYPATYARNMRTEIFMQHLTVKVSSSRCGIVRYRVPHAYLMCSHHT